LGAPLYLGLFEAVTHPYFEIIGGGGDAKKYWLTGLPRPERS